MSERVSVARLEALKKLLHEVESSTQEELREKLEEQDFGVTQSTVSRDLRKLGAVRAVDNDGRTVYRLPVEREPTIPDAITDLVLDVTTNGALIVIRTAVGSASLVARQLDRVRPEGLLGTIAGDDTIFVAPASLAKRDIRTTIQAIREALRGTGI